MADRASAAALGEYLLLDGLPGAVERRPSAGADVAVALASVAVVQVAVIARFAGLRHSVAAHGGRAARGRERILREEFGGRILLDVAAEVRAVPLVTDVHVHPHIGLRPAQ